MAPGYSFPTTAPNSSNLLIPIIAYCKKWLGSSTWAMFNLTVVELDDAICEMEVMIVVADD